MTENTRREITAYEVTVPYSDKPLLMAAPSETPGHVSVPVHGYLVETEMGTGMVITSCDSA